MGRGSGGGGGNGYGTKRTRQSIIDLAKAAGYQRVRARSETYRRSNGYLITGKDSMGRDVDIFGSARWLQKYFRNKIPYQRPNPI